MTFRRYELGDYEEMCARHRWEVPERYNIARDVCDKHERDRLAMVWEDWRGNERRVSFGELQDSSNRFANVLRAHGVEREDRVATLLPSLPETAAIFIGTYKAGAILLSMSVLYGDEGIEHRLSDSGAKLVVTDAANKDRIPEGIVNEVLVLDEELERELERAPAGFDWSTPPPRTRPSSTTRRARPGRRRASCTPTATCWRTRSSSSATTCATASCSTARASGPGPPGICPLLGPWRYGAVALVQARKGGYDPEEHLRFLSQATACRTCSRRRRRCGR